jgi:hypothetical protein
MTWETWALFLLTDLAPCVSPGLAILFVVTQGLRHGGRTALRANAGIVAASADYFALSAAGLGALTHAFGPLGVRGLFARHHPHNHGSGRVLTSLGFRYTHDEFMPQTGLRRPCYLLTAGDYGSCRPEERREER